MLCSFLCLLLCLLFVEIRRCYLSFVSLGLVILTCLTVRALLVYLFRPWPTQKLIALLFFYQTFWFSYFVRIICVRGCMGLGALSCYVLDPLNWVMTLIREGYFISNITHQTPWHHSPPECER